LSDVARVRAQIEALYGDLSLEADEGVVHVAAVWQTPAGWQVLRINDSTPKSATDLFALALARARADVILTTGQILRDEPELRMDLPGELGPALARFRREVLGRPDPPWVALLTRRGDVDPDHPALHGWATPVIVTGPEGAQAAAAAGVEVVVQPQTSVATVVAWARDEREARTISIEAGPRAAAGLYGDPPQVDELMLSVFVGARVPEAAQGPGFVVADAAAVPLPPAGPAVCVAESSGPWIFRRFRREQTECAGRPLNRTGGARNST
jgi:hypothetical protein